MHSRGKDRNKIKLVQQHINRQWPITWNLASTRMTESKDMAIFLPISTSSTRYEIRNFTFNCPMFQCNGLSTNDHWLLNIFVISPMWNNSLNLITTGYCDGNYRNLTFIELRFKRSSMYSKYIQWMKLFLYFRRIFLFLSN